MPKSEIAGLMTQRAEAVSAEIQALLAGLGARTQGAILADLVSMWLAGHVDRSELGQPIEDGRPLSWRIRADKLDEFIALVRVLVPESEKQMMHGVTPQGRA